MAKTISAQLQTDIESGSIAFLIKIELTDSTEYFFTDYPAPLTIDGDTYQPQSGLTRLKLRSKSDGEISSQDWATSWNLTNIVESDILAGKWDDARITASWGSWANPGAGKLIIGSTALGRLEWTVDGFKASTQNFLTKLQRRTIKTTTPYCRHTLYDSECQVSSGSYTHTGSVDYILSQRLKFKIAGTASSQVDDYFTNGILTWTSGNNNGLSTEIKIHEVNGDPNIGKSFELFLLTPYDIQVGDTFSAKAGCDKLFSTCQSKFNNAVNFGGFPHINPEIQFR